MTLFGYRPFTFAEYRRRRGALTALALQTTNAVVIDVRQNGGDPFAAIEAVVPWETFTQSVTEADELAQPASFDHLPLIADGYRQVHRYVPRLLEQFAFRAAPAA